MDTNKLYFGGDSGAGDVTNSVTAGGDIHYVFKRPTAREAPDGRRLFITKGVWARVAGKGGSRKIKCRVSYADGSPYDDSFEQNIAVGTSAKTAYRFGGLDFALSSKVGSDYMAVRFIGSGAFYFARNSDGAGTTISAAGTKWVGSISGWIEYAEVASAPRSLAGKRNASRGDQLDLTWQAPSDDGGGSPMGYRVQIASDSGFTKDLRDYYIAGTSTTQYGFSTKNAWYVRVAFRNEVSDHFKIPGGTWSSTVTIGAGGSSSAPADDGGGSTAKPGPQRDTSDHLGDHTFGSPVTFKPVEPSVMQSFVRHPTSGEWYVTQRQVSSTTGKESFRISRLKADGTLIDSMFLKNGGHGSQIALQVVSGVTYIWANFAWNVGATVRDFDVVRFPYKAGTYTRTQVPGLTVKIKGGGVYRLVAFDTRNNYAVVRSPSGNGTYTYRRHKLASVLAGDLSSPTGKAIVRTENGPPTMQGFATYKDALFLYYGYPADPAEVPSDPFQLLEFDWTDGSKLKTVSTIGLGQSGGAFPGNRGEPEGAAVYDPGTGSAPKLYLGLTTGPKAGHGYFAYRADLDPVISVPPPTTTPKPAPPPGGTNPSTPAPPATPGTPTTPSNPADPADPVDTTPEEIPPLILPTTPLPNPPKPSAKGGLLISRGSATQAEYRAFAYDRGGQHRIGELEGLTYVEWTRFRDEMSYATIKIDAAGARRSMKALDQMAAGRSELVLFRNDERVWEGPITLPRRYGDRVEVDAKDVLWWAERTTIRGRYDNSGTKATGAVQRIASIFLGELIRKERIAPPVNVLPYLRIYSEDGDARTSRSNFAWELNLYEHLDDMAAKTGIDYTVVGRRIHIWDTSRAALGRTRTFTEQDFTGDVYLAEYGSELATVSTVTDGQGNFAVTGGEHPFYGEIEMTQTAFGEEGNPVLNEDGQPLETVDAAELLSQAERNLKGRSPAPIALHIPETSSLVVGPDLGFDVLVPGVYIPLRITLSGQTLAQYQKLQEVKVLWDKDGEKVAVSLYPASDDDVKDAGIE